MLYFVLWFYHLVCFFCQLLLSLEGVRFCYEVCARLCVTGDYTIGDWLLRTQLNNVCRAWESAVYQVCDSCDDTLCNVSCLLPNIVI